MPNGPSDVAAGAPNVESYVDNGDGTITDKVTGLMWQQTVPAGTFTQGQAAGFCMTLALANYGDWRLPSVIELVSIVDWGQTNPTIDATYFSATAGTFWTSSPLVGSPTPQAWCVTFDDGLSTDEDLASSNKVRCVR